MNIQLSDHFTTRKLLRFTMPSIIMMVFTTVYGAVDGFFVSYFVGKTAFAAVNFIMPFLMILSAVGFMLGTGGTALIAKNMGEGEREKANSRFTFFVIVTFIFSIIISAAGLIFLRPIASLLGAEGELLENCVRYGRIMLLANPAYMLQVEFQSFFPAAEKPGLGLTVAIACGVTNMILDGLFIAVFHLGLEGAAVATSISQTVGGIVPVIYFLLPNRSLLRFTKPKIDLKALLKACVNGSSEMLSNISMSLVSMLYNIQLLKYAGEDGVAAYGVIMYVNMVFIAIFLGYSMSTSPILSYHYGARNSKELKSLLKRSIGIIGVSSVAMTAFALLFSKPLSLLFVGYDPGLQQLTQRGFLIFSFSFLFAGFAIFCSGFFTALNDGLTSAAISFLRTLVFQIAAVFLLPLAFGLDGIWLSLVVAEIMAVAIGALFLFLKRKKYQY